MSHSVPVPGSHEFGQVIRLRLLSQRSQQWPLLRLNRAFAPHLEWLTSLSEEDSLDYCEKIPFRGTEEVESRVVEPIVARWTNDVHQIAQRIALSAWENREQYSRARSVGPRLSRLLASRFVAKAKADVDGYRLYETEIGGMPLDFSYRLLVTKMEWSVGLHGRFRPVPLPAFYGFAAFPYIHTEEDLLSIGPLLDAWLKEARDVFAALL